MSRKQAFLFVNGEMPREDAAAALVKPGDFIVAVDGGLKHVLRLKLEPQLAVGDFDSIDAGMLDKLRNAGVEIRCFPKKKDETDLELALRIVIEKGWQSIRIVGALGDRLDHTLGNIFLLGLPALRELDVRLDDGVEEVFFIRGGATVVGKPGDVVSLIPLDEAALGVSTAGLEYPLRDETLFRHKTRGISNVLEAESADIEVREGALLCVHTRKVKVVYLGGKRE